MCKVNYNLPKYGRMQTEVKKNENEAWIYDSEQSSYVFELWLLKNEWFHSSMLAFRPSNFVVFGYENKWWHAMAMMITDAGGGAPWVVNFNTLEKLVNLHSWQI